MDPMPLTFTDAELIAVWQDSLEALIAVTEPLDDAQWALPTPCPGWTVADVVAHTIDIEQIFGGDPRPDHVPDWAALPHAASGFGQFTEVGVDVRRGRPKDEVLAELGETIARRRAALDALPPGAEVIGITGKLVPVSRFVRTRTFDAWVHQQDIRTALGSDGGWSTQPAIVAFQQMAGALPIVWAKSVGAQPGTSVRLTVTGPGLASDVAATVTDDGKGVPAEPNDDATVHLTVSWPDYMALSSGRLPLDDTTALARMTVSGDQALGTALLTKLAITP